MITIRPASERGYANHGWLDTFHTFSFADYWDEDHVQFRNLRVINEDRIAGGGGFPIHGHRDMEIITWIVDGALEHKDSLGTGATIRPGDAQRMSAGFGIRHSEFNASRTVPVHLLQIWIEPSRTGIKPGYEQKHFPVSERQGRLRLVASPDGQEGSITITADASLYSGVFAPGETGTVALGSGRYAWVQVIKGTMTVNGTALAAGDGAALSGESQVQVTATAAAEVLVFDLG